MQNGGGGSASGGGFVLRGTIGQPDAALSGGEGYDLIGGFWNGGLAGSDGNHRVYLPLVLDRQ